MLTIFQLIINFFAFLFSGESFFSQIFIFIFVMGIFRLVFYLFGQEDDNI